MREWVELIVAMDRIRLACLVALLFALLTSPLGCGSRLADSPDVSSYDGRVATERFDLLYREVKLSGAAPAPASRGFGYAAIALYEALVPGMPGHSTLQGQLNAFSAGSLPAPKDARYHWPAAANRALAVVAARLLPSAKRDIEAQESRFLEQFKKDQPIDVLDRSRRFGEDVANVVLTWAASDGIAQLAPCNAAYVPPREPNAGGWVPTGPDQGAGALPCWGTLRTYVLADGRECSPSQPPLYSTSSTSAYYGQALVVYGTTGDAGANLTPDQRGIAQYWTDGPASTGTPGGHWISIVRVVAAAQKLPLDVTAEAYARVGIALHDAFITCWRTKYDVYLARPVTYIQANIDRSWHPLLSTPPFPAYSSGHSTQSAAAATVLTGLFGPLPFTDTTHSDLNPALGLANRSFANFFDAANEAAVSRLYGGIHWSFDNQDGLAQGQCVGDIVNSRIRFRN